MAPVNQFCRWLLLLTLAALSFCSAGVWAQSKGKANKRTRDVSSFRKQYAERRQKYTDSLLELARVCEKEKYLPEAATEIRRFAEPVEATELRLAPLPRRVQGSPKDDLGPDERFWRAQLKSRQQDYAKELYALSRQALAAGHVSFAFDLVREIVQHDSDHRAARKILGFVLSGDEWLTAFEALKLRKKEVWTDDFGWLPKNRVERYQRGERYYKKGWVSAAEEAKFRSNFEDAWEIRTEHYLVKTNHSLEKGVDLARKLEDFHGLFFQMMAGFFNSAADVEQLFAGNNARPLATAAKPNVVHFFRERDEYMATLKKLTNQRIEITKGIYFPSNRIAFFFYDPDSDDDTTLYHEATHQLLTGSRPMTGEIGVKSDFWIIEGIACYMESFQREGDRCSVGDPGNQRLQAARGHFVRENYYVPMHEFTRMGMIPFQTVAEANLRKNYSQGAALTHFFMHYDDGRYREALIEYLSQIYSPDKTIRENPDSLEELTGVTAEDLDRQYAGYIRQLVPLSGQEKEPVSDPSQQTCP
jgi:hypothetical protein